MKKFSVKISLFLLVPSMLYVGSFSFLVSQFRNKIENSDYIILGDSHTQFLKDDEIYNGTFNGCPYFVHFEFAQKFADQLKGKKVFISCNYHNLSKLYQNRLVNNDLLPNWKQFVFDRMNDFNILDIGREQLTEDGLTYNKEVLKKLRRLFQTVYFSNELNESNSVENDTLSIGETIHNHYYHEDYLIEDSVQVLYLRKLVSFLDSINCEVTLIKMPLTNYYKENVPKDIKREFVKLSHNMGVRTIDFDSLLDISKEYKYFKDYAHLNVYGDSLTIDLFKKLELK